MLPVPVDSIVALVFTPETYALPVPVFFRRRVVMLPVTTGEPVLQGGDLESEGRSSLLQLPYGHFGQSTTMKLIDNILKGIWPPITVLLAEEEDLP